MELEGKGSQAKREGGGKLASCRRRAAAAAVGGLGRLVRS